MTSESCDKAVWLMCSADPSSNPLHALRCSAALQSPWGLDSYFHRVISKKCFIVLDSAGTEQQSLCSENCSAFCWFLELSHEVTETAKLDSESLIPQWSWVNPKSEPVVVAGTAIDLGNTLCLRLPVWSAKAVQEQSLGHRIFSQNLWL